MGKNWRRGKSKNIGLTACNAIAGRLKADYLTFSTWDRVGKKYGVSGGLAYRVANGYEPRGAKARAALGFPVLVPAPACACGEVHLRKGRCPNAPKPTPPAWVTAAADLLACRERVAPAPVRVYGRGGKAVTW